MKNIFSLAMLISGLALTQAVYVDVVRNHGQEVTSRYNVQCETSAASPTVDDVKKLAEKVKTGPGTQCFTDNSHGSKCSQIEVSGGAKVSMCKGGDDWADKVAVTCRDLQRMTKAVADKCANGAKKAGGRVIREQRVDEKNWKNGLGYVLVGHV